MAANESTNQSPGRLRLDFRAQPQAPALEPGVASEDEPEIVEAITPEPAVDVYALTVKPGPVILKAPKNCAPFSVDGEIYEPDGDGHVEVPFEHVARLAAHGFTVV